MGRLGLLFLSASWVLLVAGCGASPRWDTASRIVSQVEDAELLRILEAAGFDCQRIEPGAIRVVLGDYTALLLVQSDSLLIHAGFSNKPSLHWVNEWNRDSRFSRCYLDSEGDVNLEWDLILVGGVSEQNLVEFIGRFSRTIEAFVDSLTEETTLSATL